MHRPAGTIGALLLTAAFSGANATITSFSATLESAWPSSREVPLVGSASVALDDSTNELSWEVQWAGSSSRRARVTMVGLPCTTGPGCAEGPGPLVLDLADDVSTADVRGGELSGSLRLTPEQAEELGSSEAWRVELRLWDKRGVRLEGELQLDVLPPGVWL